MAARPVIAPSLAPGPPSPTASTIPATAEIGTPNLYDASIIAAVGSNTFSPGAFWSSDGVRLATSDGAVEVLAKVFVDGETEVVAEMVSSGGVGGRIESCRGLFPPPAYVAAGSAAFVDAAKASNADPEDSDVQASVPARRLLPRSS